MALTPTSNIQLWQGGKAPHASVAEVLQAMATLPATFASVTVQGVKLCPGPSNEAFAALGDTVAATDMAISDIGLFVDGLSVRVASLESTMRPQFSDEFSPEFA